MKCGFCCWKNTWCQICEVKRWSPRPTKESLDFLSILLFDLKPEISPMNFNISQSFKAWNAMSAFGARKSTCAHYICRVGSIVFFQNRFNSLWLRFNKLTETFFRVAWSTLTWQHHAVATVLLAARSWCESPVATHPKGVQLDWDLVTLEHSGVQRTHYRVWEMMIWN